MIKVLVVTQPQLNGLTYHRQIVPHKHLEREYSEVFKVDATTDITQVPDEFLKEYNIVSFLRLVDASGLTTETINRCKDNGCKVVIDIDDYWALPKDHELLPRYTEYKVGEQTVEGLKLADYVTTTTSHFAEKIKYINSNVQVLPNSIDPTEPQYERKEYSSERVRFGWVGGVYHAPDLRLLYEGIKEFTGKIPNSKYQFCLGGYGNNQMYNFAEKVFTNEYKTIKDKKYLSYLKEFKQEGNELSETQPYKRMWGSKVTEYCQMYNELDICLVPLRPTEFSSCKSQIKIIESGYFNKATIVSNVMPYKIDCDRENSILINPSNSNDSWYIAMRSLLNNEEKRKYLANELHELVMNNYLMDKVNVTRKQLYERICE